MKMIMPVNNYYIDFDKNGRFEFVTTKYLKDRKGVLKEFIVNGRDDVMDQIPALKKRFLSYHSFAEAVLKDVFTIDQWNGIEQRTASYFKTVIVVISVMAHFVLKNCPGRRSYLL
jgi:hypothetical protein